MIIKTLSGTEVTLTSNGSEILAAIPTKNIAPFGVTFDGSTLSARFASKGQRIVMPLAAEFVAGVTQMFADLKAGIDTRIAEDIEYGRQHDAIVNMGRAGE